VLCRTGEACFIYFIVLALFSDTLYAIHNKNCQQLNCIFDEFAVPNTGMPVYKGANVTAELPIFVNSQVIVTVTQHRGLSMLTVCLGGIPSAKTCFSSILVKQVVPG